MPRKNQRYDSPNQIIIPYEVLEKLSKQQELLQKMMIEIKALRLEVKALKDTLQKA